MTHSLFNREESFLFLLTFLVHDLLTLSAKNIKNVLLNNFFEFIYRIPYFS